MIVLNKADLCPDLDEAIAQAEGIAFGVPIHTVSAVAGQGLAELGQYLRPGATVALLGSSGVGKSTLFNSLSARSACRWGRCAPRRPRPPHHTHRERCCCPAAAWSSTTPASANSSCGPTLRAGQAFGDVDALAAHCRFSDCRHENEPGCAVQAALADGSLDPERFQSYRKLQRELHFLETRQNQRVAIEEKARLKRRSRMSKTLQRYGGKS